jgi:hypothetical protein
LRLRSGPRWVGAHITGANVGFASRDGAQGIGELERGPDMRISLAGLILLIIVIAILF